MTVSILDGHAVVMRNLKQRNDSRPAQRKHIACKWRVDTQKKKKKKKKQMHDFS